MAAAGLVLGCAFTLHSPKLRMTLPRSVDGCRCSLISNKKQPPHLFISTKPSDVNPEELRDLFRCCNLSCHRFPDRDAAGGVETPDVRKLRLALRHSSVVVSAFSRPEELSPPSSESNKPDQSQVRPDLLNRMMPLTPANGKLVGFGRAVSDIGLTASIYDVMVVPSLRKMGIGQMIVKRIIRMLTSRGVYDIAALCSEEERSFFKACGFGEDILCSTTMMYAKAPTAYPAGDHIVTRAGRKLLLAPAAPPLPPMDHSPS